MAANQPLMMGAPDRPGVTHARLMMYPKTLLILYGTMRGDEFRQAEGDHNREMLPLHVYPELRDLSLNGHWNVDEVAFCFGFTLDERLNLTLAGELAILAHPAGVTTGSLSGAG